MAAKQAAKQLEAQSPLILRCNRLIEAFAKSDDERDFYIDRQEGFIIYADLDKAEDQVHLMETELLKNSQRYCLIPKLTFYETKKIMEGFVNEKVYDVDTKDKLLDIIQSKEARENFLEFIYDHHNELEKWQIFYQERSRIRVIEWLCANHFHFVFEEDLELPSSIVEKLKKEIFLVKVNKEVEGARKTLQIKAKSYYSNEALNPRPKRGRPPKQALKVEFEPQVTTDVLINVPDGLRAFIFTPEFNQSSSTFSTKFGYEEDLLASRLLAVGDNDLSMSTLNSKLAALRDLSSKWGEKEDKKKTPLESFEEDDFNFDDDDDDDDDFDDEEEANVRKSVSKKAKKIAVLEKSVKSSVKTANLKPVKSIKAVKKPVKMLSKASITTQLKATTKTKEKPIVKPKSLAKVAVSSKVDKSPKKQASSQDTSKKSKILRPIMKLKAKKKIS